MPVIEQTPPPATLPRPPAGLPGFTHQHPVFRRAVPDSVSATRTAGFPPDAVPTVADQFIYRLNIVHHIQTRPHLPVHLHLPSPTYRLQLPLLHTTTLPSQTVPPYHRLPTHPLPRYTTHTLIPTQILATHTLLYCNPSWSRTELILTAHRSRCQQLVPTVSLLTPTPPVHYRPGQTPVPVCYTDSVPDTHTFCWSTVVPITFSLNPHQTYLQPSRLNDIALYNLFLTQMTTRCCCRTPRGGHTPFPFPVPVLAGAHCAGTQHGSPAFYS